MARATKAAPKRKRATRAAPRSRKPKGASTPKARARAEAAVEKPKRAKPGKKPASKPRPSAAAAQEAQPKRKPRPRKAPPAAPSPISPAVDVAPPPIAFAPLSIAEPSLADADALSTAEVIAILVEPEPIESAPFELAFDDEAEAAAAPAPQPNAAPVSLSSFPEHALVFDDEVEADAAPALQVEQAPACAQVAEVSDPGRPPALPPVAVAAPLEETVAVTPRQPAALRLDNAAPRPNAYLDRARSAARAQAEALRQSQPKGFFARLFENRGLLFSLGASALAFLTAGLLVAGRGEPAGKAASISVAEANAAPADAASGSSAVEAYEQARRLIAAGRSVQGLRLLESAAADGLTAAQYDLSKRYEAGDGVARNLSLALSWAERAARGGEVRAMHDVGVYYARGEGVAIDEAAAFGWFRQAALHGVPDSQYNLGVLYEQGRGVAAEPEEALFWYLVAARNEDDDALDRAVTLASTLPPDGVARAQERAHAFFAASARADRADR